MSSGTLSPSRYKYRHSLFSRSLHGTVQIKQKVPLQVPRFAAPSNTILALGITNHTARPGSWHASWLWLCRKCIFIPCLDPLSPPAPSSLNILASPLSTFFHPSSHEPHIPSHRPSFNMDSSTPRRPRAPTITVDTAAVDSNEPGNSPVR